MTLVGCSEIYPSVQGEGIHFGRPCVFIRFQGCAVGCHWCDTKYSWSPVPTTEAQLKYSKWLGQLTPEEIAEKAKAFGINYFVITGGEPTEQMQGLKELINLLSSSVDRVDIEVWTSGSVPFENLDEYPVSFALDWKLTSARVKLPTLEDNLWKLGPGDCIKTVISSHTDWVEFVTAMNDFRIQAIAGGRDNDGLPQVIVSPVFGNDGILQNAQELVGWMMERAATKPAYEIRLSIQNHKLVWSPTQRGV